MGCADTIQFVIVNEGMFSFFECSIVFYFSLFKKKKEKNKGLFGCTFFQDRKHNFLCFFKTV